MGDDEQFAEYVATRWTMLHRLATVLAGAEGADDLAQAALVQAYLSWPEVRQSASPDADVRRILARTAVKGAGRRAERPVPPAGATSSADLEQQIRALLPRQRAVLVLRHHEGLSDPEIADALGCPAATVAAEALALETGVDLARLRELFTRQSDEARVPLPPVDSLLARARDARRRRRRRSWRWAGGVAVAVAVVLVAANLVQGEPAAPPPAGPGTTPPPAARFLAMLPTGRPPRVAYAEGRSLHLGSGQQVALEEVPSSMVQTSKWLYVAYLSGAIVRVDAVRGTVLRVARSSRGELATDPSGQHVAWLAAGPGPAVVVLRTAWDWGVLLSDRQRFPAEPRCCDDPFVLNGITGDGKVIGSLPVANRAWVWSVPDAGSDTVEAIAGLDGGAITQVAPDGLVVRHPPGIYAIGGVVEGGFRPSAVLTAKQADFGDPFGRRIVYADDGGEIRVRERLLRGRSRRPASDVRLLLPTLPDGFGDVRWEDPDHVLLDLSDPSLPHGSLVRCDVGTGACEVAVRFDGPHLVAE